MFIEEKFDLEEVKKQNKVKCGKKGKINKTLPKVALQKHRLMMNEVLEKKRTEKWKIRVVTVNDHVIKVINQFNKVAVFNLLVPTNGFLNSKW